MKNQLKWAVIICLFFLSCKKTDTPVPTSGIQATKTSAIKLGEPVIFTVPQISTTDSIAWSAFPITNVNISTSGNSASIIFGNPGTYVITAKTAINNYTNTIHIDTAHYLPPTDANDLQIITNDDNITITPSLIGIGDSVAVQFIAATSKKYNCLNNFLAGRPSYDGGNLKISYSGVMKASPNCTSGMATAISNIRLYPFKEGINSFKIVLNGIEYSGSVNKNGRVHVFTWPYDSKVIISPLTIN